jgi:hypothetical protein
MDRRAKKLEQKRKNRALAKKKAAALGKGNRTDAMARSAAKQPFGPCFVSRGWDDTTSPELVSVIVTRKLASGLLLPGLALVDRTCLGVKSGFVAEPLAPHELRGFVEHVGTPHGGMDECAPLLVQSIVFHALDYARSLGFEPDPDFKVSLFEPRPSELLATAWSAPERPIYAFGPHDDVRAIAKRLENAVGTEGYDFVDPFAADEEEGDDAEELDVPVVYSPLGRDVSDEDGSVEIRIYRGVDEPTWILELEDALGGSTVWNDRFDSDELALEAALLAIKEEGIRSFYVESSGV